MKIYMTLAVLVGSTTAFNSPAFVGRRSQTSLFLSGNGDKAAEAIDKAKEASEKYGPSSPEAALAWEGKGFSSRFSFLFVCAVGQILFLSSSSPPPPSFSQYFPMPPLHSHFPQTMQPSKKLTVEIIPLLTK